MDSISKKERIVEEGYDPMAIGSAIIENYMHQVLDVGTFHGDPHQGNIMLSHGKPYWIDFGMIGHVSDANLNMIQGLLVSLLEKDTEALATIEGVIEELCPELNLFELLTKKMMERVKQNFDIQQQLLNIGKDALELGKKTAKLPVLASDALNSIVKGRMKMNMELTGYDELLKNVNSTVKNIVLAIFACVLFFGSCVLCMTDFTPQTGSGIPLLAAVGFVFSVSLAVYTVKQMVKK